MPVRTLPSGLKIEFEELGTEAEDLIAEAKDSADAQVREAIDGTLMDMAWRQTLTPGPTPCLADGRPNWELMLLGDKVDYVHQLIVESWGGDIQVRGECPQRHTESYAIDIGELPIQRLDPSVAAMVKQGQTLELRLPKCGRLVHWSPVTVQRARQAIHDGTDYPGQRSTNNLLSRIVRIDGFDPDTGLDPETKWDAREFVRRLKGKDTVALRQEFERYECGVEMIVERKCPHSGCGRSVAINLGEATPDFFAMSEAAKTSTTSGPTSSLSPSG